MDEQRPLLLAMRLLSLHSALDDLLANLRFAYGYSDEWRSKQLFAFNRCADRVRGLARTGVDDTIHRPLGREPHQWTVELLVLLSEASGIAVSLASPAVDIAWSQQQVDDAEGVVHRIYTKYVEASAVAHVTCLAGERAPPSNKTEVRVPLNEGISRVEKYFSERETEHEKRLSDVTSGELGAIGKFNEMFSRTAIEGATGVSCGSISKISVYKQSQSRLKAAKGGRLPRINSSQLATSSDVPTSVAGPDETVEREELIEKLFKELPKAAAESIAHEIRSGELSVDSGYEMLELARDQQRDENSDIVAPEYLRHASHA